MGYPVAYRNGATAPTSNPSSQMGSDATMAGSPWGGGGALGSGARNRMMAGGLPRRIIIIIDDISPVAIEEMAPAPVVEVAEGLLPRVFPWLLAFFLAYEIWSEINEHLALEGKRDFNLAGYSLFCSGADAPDEFSTGTFPGACSATKWAYSAGSPHGFPAVVDIMHYVGPYLPSPQFHFGPVAEEWHKNAVGPYEITNFGPMQMRRPNYNVRPHTRPVVHPQGVQWPLPWGIRPWLDRHEDPLSQTYAGYEPATGWNWTDPVPVVPVDPVDPDDPPHEHRPPGKREKERKWTVQGSVGSLMSVYNWMTEARDMVSAIHYALPRSLQAKPFFYRDPVGAWRKAKPNASDMLSAIYRHIDAVDLSKALKNAMINEIGDRVAGRIGRTQAWAARKVFDQGYGNRPVAYTISRRGSDYGQGQSIGQWLSDNWPW